MKNNDLTGNQPEDKPYTLNRNYKNAKWKNWEDFLGTGNSSGKTFEEAREFVTQFGLKTYGEWHKFCNSKYKPNTISSNPDKVDKNKDQID